MISAVVLAAVINADHVNAAIKRLNAFCTTLKCHAPVLVSIHPDTKEKNFSVRRILNSEGCSISLRNEAVYRDDWLAKAACRCANDYAVLDEDGWLGTLSDAEVKKRETAASACAAKILKGVAH